MKAGDPKKVLEVTGGDFFEFNPQFDYRWLKKAVREMQREISGVKSVRIKDIKYYPMTDLAITYFVTNDGRENMLIVSKKRGKWYIACGAIGDPIFKKDY